MRVLAVTPMYARVHLNIGNALRKLDRLDEAATAFRDALQCEPAYFQARFNLGSLLASRGEFEAASNIAKRAIAKIVNTVALECAQDGATIERLSPMPLGSKS